MHLHIHALALLSVHRNRRRGFCARAYHDPRGHHRSRAAPITKATEFVGRVEAIERVEIRARVTGSCRGPVQGRRYREGGRCPLPDRAGHFQAAVQQAQGALFEAQGKFANATAQRARTQELAKTDAASQALLDERIADEKSAQGQVVIADANLKTANVNLGYTDITAPITGEIGRTKLTKGNVVGPDSGPLTVIVSRDPMYVTFPVSQREFLKVQEQEERKARRGRRWPCASASRMVRPMTRRGRSTSWTSRWIGRPTPSWCARPCPIPTARSSMASSSGFRSKPTSPRKRCWCRRRR